MRNLIFALIVIGLVTAGGWQEAYWANHNPNIYHFLGIEVWNTNVMHESLDSLELENVNTSNITNANVKIYISSAQDAKAKAVFSKLQCNALYADVIGDMPTNTVGLSVFGPSAFMAKAFYLMAIEITKKSFSDCGDYGTYWRETMNNAEKALLVSSEQMQVNFDSGKESYETARSSGVCDENYAGSPKEYCKNAELEYETVVIAKAKIDAYDQFFESDGKKDVPNLNGYSGILTTIWNTGIPNSLKTKADATAAVETAEKDYQTITKDTEMKMADAKQQIKNLENAKVSLITDSSYSTESTDTIAARYEILMEKSKEGDARYINASFVHAAKSPGYLKDSINEMKGAYFSYEWVASNSKITMDDAKNLTEMQRTEAVNEIKKFEAVIGTEAPATDAKASYETAKEKLGEGDATSKLGDKFEYYSDSAAAARMALVKQKQTNAEKEAVITAEFKKTQEMISNAKKDGIEVNYEESELTLLNGITADWVNEELVDIQQGIYTKAEIKYGYLEGKHYEILQKIGAADGKLDDLLTDMSKAEGTAFVNGKLDYETGLGQFSEIAKKYQYIDGEIDKEMKTIVANSIVSTTNFEMDEVELNVPVNITAAIFLHNKLGTGAKGVLIKIKSPVEFMENELTLGAEFVDSVTYTSGNLNLYLREINSYENQDITFKKFALVANSLRQEKTVVGNPDGTADVEEKITFEALYDLNGMYAPERFTKWTIDGREGRGRKTANLVKGTHTLAGTYKIEDAFGITKQEYRAISIGLNSEVSYDLVITPKTDMDKALILLNEPGSDNITGFSVTAYSAGIGLANRKSLGNGIYSFEIDGVKSGGNVTLRVAYTVPRSVDYVKEQISVLKGIDTSPATKGFVVAAESALNENDSRRAVENIEKARYQIEEENNELLIEQAKLTRTKDNIVPLQEEVLEADSTAKELAVSTQTIAKLDARNGVIKNALAAESNSELANFDFNWEKKQVIEMKKQFVEQYNQLKEQYLQLNAGVARDSEFVNFEASLAKLEASGSLNDAVITESALQKVSKLVSSKNSIAAIDYEIVITEAKLTSDKTTEIVAVYAKESDAAKGTPLAAIFTYDYKNVQKEIKALDNLIEKKSSKDIVSSKTTEVKKMQKGMQEIINYVQSESNRKLESLKSIYNTKKDSLDENEKKLSEQGLVSMETQISKGNYAAAITTGDAVTKIISKQKTQDNVLVILGLTALLVIGGIVLYLMGRKKERRIPRKLRSADGS